MKKKIAYFTLASVIASFAAVIACAQSGPQIYVPPEFATSGNSEFDAWRKDFAARAVNEKQKDPTTIESMMTGIAPNQEVTRLNDSQPEVVRPIWIYINNAVSQARINTGRAHLQERANTLGEIAKSLGVPLDYAISIWAMESGYGGNKGNMDVIRSLATFAYKGRRTQLGESELLAVADILKNNYAKREDLIGSWAGAMGHTQFMPSSFLSKAVDGDNDGKRDIWNNPNDALASTLNYLAAVGWKANEPWGRQVELGSGFDYSLADGQMRPLRFWRANGLVNAWADLPNEWQARLLVPAGANGPKFLVGANYNAIRHYNASDSYSLSVAFLADRIAQRGQMPNNWPLNDPPLGRTQILEMQNILNRMGIDVGTADGQAGTKTKAGLQAFQKSRGLVADGYPNAKALADLHDAIGIAPPQNPQSAPIEPIAKAAPVPAPNTSQIPPIRMFGPKPKTTN